MMQKVMAMTSIHHSRRTLMNCTQNEKLNQVTPHTLIVGVDIAKSKHIARAQDNRGKILSQAFQHRMNCSHLKLTIINFSTYKPNDLFLLI
jgi:hypothetical protein